MLVPFASVAVAVIVVVAPGATLVVPLICTDTISETFANPVAETISKGTNVPRSPLTAIGGLPEVMLSVVPTNGAPVFGSSTSAPIRTSSIVCGPGLVAVKVTGCPVGGEKLPGPEGSGV